MIKKVGGQYVVLSETSGRLMGSYRTKALAKKRLRQVEFFKHLANNPKMRAKMRKKSLRVRTTK